MDDDLDAEEEMQRETQWGAESHIEQHEEEEMDEDELEALREGEGERPRFEDNGLLGSDEAGPSTTRPSRSVAPPITIVDDIEEDEQQDSWAGPSTRPLAAAASTRYEPTIPKYIPAGHFNAISMDGEVLRFERRRRLKGW